MAVALLTRIYMGIISLSIGTGKKMADSSKPTRGRPLRHGEAKQRREITVTPTAWAGLEALAAKGDCSVSEVIERLGRGLMGVDGPQSDVLEVVRWGNVHCTAQDALGNVYRCKREQEAP